jgi:hypothetical protein
MSRLGPDQTHCRKTKVLDSQKAGLVCNYFIFTEIFDQKDQGRANDRRERLLHIGAVNVTCVEGLMDILELFWFPRLEKSFGYLKSLP